MTVWPEASVSLQVTGQHSKDVTLLSSLQM